MDCITTSPSFVLLVRSGDLQLFQSQVIFNNWSLWDLSVNIVFFGQSTCRWNSSRVSSFVSTSALLPCNTVLSSYIAKVPGIEYSLSIKQVINTDKPVWDVLIAKILVGCVSVDAQSLGTVLSIPCCRQSSKDLEMEKWADDFSNHLTRPTFVNRFLRMPPCKFWCEEFSSEPIYDFQRWWRSLNQSKCRIRIWNEHLCHLISSSSHSHISKKEYYCIK